MTYIEDMAAALHLAKAWVPNTAHGEIVRKRIVLAIAGYERQHPRVKKQQVQPAFVNRLMR